MKKKMDQLLSGKFEYTEPQMLFSCEKIMAVVDAGETDQGEIYVGTDENVRIRGYVTSSSRRLVPGAEEFSGTTIVIPYGIDAKGLKPGEHVTGWLCFTSNIGEYKLPFEISVKNEKIQSSGSEVKNLEEFRKIAEKDFREAFRLFTQPAFAAMMKDAPVYQKALYAGLSRQPVTYQHLEEFLVSSKLKEPVQIFLKKTEGEYMELKESVEETFEIQRSGWGHLRLELEAYGAFLELPRRILTDGVFIGSKYQAAFILHRELLGNETSYGKIVVRSPYGEQVFRIRASKGNGVSVHVQAKEKKLRAAIARDYLSYRTGGMSFSAWAKKSHEILDALEEMGNDYPEYQMFHTFLLHLEGKDEDAKKILLNYQNKSFRKNDMEFAGVYLYLCTLTGLYRDVAQAIHRVQTFYKQKEDSFVLLYVLLRMDQEYRDNPSQAVWMLEEQYEKGCNSPLLYLEAWKLIKEDFSLLHRLTPFWYKVFLFAGKRKLLTEEMVVRLAYLSGYEKSFDPCLYLALSIGYQQYPSTETLESICKYIMQGNPRKPEYFKWYSLAVEKGIRLTRLYEYYMETLEDDCLKPLPKQLLVYFSYNTNTLSDAKRALLYANIVNRKAADPYVYASYRERMKKFAREKLFEGKISKNYAALYQEYFEQPDHGTDAELISRKMYTYRLYCDDKKIRQVIVRHLQMEKEEVYPLVQGIAYPRIYTKDAVILFQDEKQRRYVTTVAYSLQPLMDEKEMQEAVLDYGIKEPGVLLHYCENTSLTSDSMEIFLRLVQAEGISDTYRATVRKKILDHYAAQPENGELENGIRSLDYHSYAQVDKKTLLELLIRKGLYQEAMDIVEEFGCEGVEETMLLKLISRMISRGDPKDSNKKEELLALASRVFSMGKYDEVILRYLMENRFGPMDELLSIWKSASGFEMDTFAFEEKLLSLLVFTSDYRKEGETILEHYVKQCGKERIVGAYLTQVAYGCFVKEYPITAFIRQCLEHAYKMQWPVNRICQYTLLKALTKEKDTEGRYTEMKKALYEECRKENLVFSFFRKLPASLLAPDQLDDKSFVEIHVSPQAKVSLVYALDTGQGAEAGYKNESLINEYEGIFVRGFTLFYGESLRYYFVIEENGKTRKTAERVLTMNRTDSTSRSKYQMINRILAAKKLDKEKEAALQLKKYLRQEQYVQYMFQVEEEE